MSRAGLTPHLAEHPGRRTMNYVRFLTLCRFWLAPVAIFPDMDADL